MKINPNIQGCITLNPYVKYIQVHANGTFKEPLDLDFIALQDFPGSQSKTKSKIWETGCDQTSFFPLSA